MNKHIKPTISLDIDENHLNELLVKYWQREAKEARALLNNKCEFCNEIPLSQNEKDWIKKNANKELS
jgi:ABC-type oligopeptide transport system substrate-binding subunit